MIDAAKLKEIKERLQKEIVVPEAYLTALFWNNPDLYNFYPDEKINRKSFLNPQYSYFFQLGREMAGKLIKDFDDISTSKVVIELKHEKHYDGYGGYETISELMEEVRDREENLESYYLEVKKYQLIYKLCEFFGERVLETKDKYNYKKMSKEQLHTYWNDKILQLAMDGDNKYDEYYLLDGLDEEIEEMDKHPDVGMPFYKSPKLNGITTGFANGHVYMYGGFGGSGKTSFTVNKVVMACIEQKEKLLVIANEQSIKEFRKMLLITAMGVGTEKYVNRQKLNEGGFTEDEKDRLHAAKQWLYDLCDSDKKLITFVFMENYVMNDVKKLIRYYAARGIKKYIVDTAKPSEGDNQMVRWERFVEDAKEFYKLARQNGGGLNLGIWMNVQLADTALKMRFLNEFALGEGKKAKNEASVLFLGRFMWDDEYKGGKNPLIVTHRKKDDFTGNYELVHEALEQEKDITYFLIFTGKNRRGQDNKTGQRVLVLKPYFGINTWYEIGWCTVYNDQNY